MNKTTTALVITLALLGTASFLLIQSYLNLKETSLDIDLVDEEGIDYC